MSRFSVKTGAATLMALALSQLGLGQITAGTIKTAVEGTEVPSVVSRSIMLGHTDPSKTLHMAVCLPTPAVDALEAFVHGVSDPKSPNYHKFISPEEVGSRFGLSLDKVQSVANWLTSQGLTVKLVAKNRMSILVDGSVSQVEKAFNVEIDDYQTVFTNEAGASNFYSLKASPSVPTAIAPYVSNITGLESFTRPQHRQVLTPDQTRTLYNLAPLYNSSVQGQGRTVGISNWDGYRLSNVPLYYSHFGLPSPPGGVGSNITVVTISGGAGSGNPGAEGDLDIQMPLGMSPLCNLRVYDGGNSDLIGVLTSESNENLADVISESYGWNLPASTATSAHNLHLSMSAEGITYMAASGDSGTSLEPYSYPDYDPEVLMVGGTVATTDSSGNRTSEVGWSGGGGGWSTNTATFNVLPSWQHGTGVPTNIAHRLVPDIAAHASGGSTGAYYFYLNGSLTSGYIGTSFASPMFAGSLAAAEQQIINNGGLPADGSGHHRFGRIQDLFYSQNQRSDVWLDITSGSNGTLPNGSTSNAGPGWDFNTGWGAINWNGFVATQGTPTIPPVPTGLTATGGNAQVVLSWSSSPGATSYNVKRATVSGGPYTTIASPTSAGYTDTGVTNGTTYFYVVSAVNSVGESSNSGQASATPSVPVADFTITASPSSRNVRHGRSTSFTVTVTGSGGFSGSVSLSSSGLGSGATGSFSPASITGSGSSTFNVSTSRTASTGTFTVTLKGTSGSLNHSTTVTLTVN